MSVNNLSFSASTWQHLEFVLCENAEREQTTLKTKLDCNYLIMFGENVVKIPLINNYIVLPNSNIDLPLCSYCFSWFLIILPICYYCLVHLWLRFALVHLWVVELLVLGCGHIEDVPSEGRITLRATSISTSRIWRKDNFDVNNDINIKNVPSGGGAILTST